MNAPDYNIISQKRIFILLHNFIQNTAKVKFCFASHQGYNLNGNAPFSVLFL